MTEKVLDEESLPAPYKLISTSVYPGVTEVRLYAQTVEHVKEHHPEIPLELPCISAAVEQCIVSPTSVEASYSNSVIFVDTDTTNASGDPLRIPVKIVEGTSGRVKTIYFASTEDQPQTLWRRP
jgi:hypothetical protein